MLSGGVGFLKINWQQPKDTVVIRNFVTNEGELYFYQLAIG